MPHAVSLLYLCVWQIKKDDALPAASSNIIPLSFLMFKSCAAVLKSYDEVISMQTHAPHMLCCGAYVGNEGLNLVYAQFAQNDAGPAC